LPSRESFTYIDTPVGGPRSMRLPFELVFQCDTEDEEPTEEMASLAAAVLENESRLVPLMLEAVWSDLNDQGPESGMWWHGDLSYPDRGGNCASAARDVLTELELPIPKCSSDLLKIWNRGTS
jgi:hypothetical protein